MGVQDVAMSDGTGTNSKLQAADFLHDAKEADGCKGPLGVEVRLAFAMGR